MLTDHLLQAILLFTKSIFLFVTAGFIIRRQSFKEPVKHELALYALAAGGGSILQAVGQMLSWLGCLSAADLLRITLYEGLLLTSTFLYLSQAFLRLEISRRWWAGGGGVVILALVLESNGLPFKGGWGALRPTVTLGVQVLGCALFTGLIVWLIITAIRRARQPLHFNRILYWTLAYSFMLLGGTLVFAGVPLVGNSLQLLAVPLLAYVALSHELLDIRQMVQRSATYLAATALVALIYLGIFAVAETLNRRAVGINPWRTWVALALISALLLSPLAALSQRLVQRLLRRREYKPSQILGEYGLSISNILDLERLATVAIGLISEAMEIKHGTLFVVDFTPEAARQPACYRLRGVRGIGAELPPEGQLSGANPVAEYLRDERRPLTQYDIDFLPRFRELPPEARAWLDSLDMDVYVPVYSKNAWIGLFGLGPKLSRNRYFDDDLSLLSILADHTAVALENARLVEGLQQLNQDLSKAYASLDQANHLLAQLDRTKTEFINIISHELGTPLMHIDSYNHLLHDDPLVQNSADLLELSSGMQKGIGRMYEIVQTMLDIAKLDTRTLELQIGSVQILEPIKAVAEELKPALTARRLALEIKNLRNLPAVEADGESLRKAFYHLMINAIKYTPDGGKITINGVKVEGTSPAEPGEGLDITVTDTGIGIDPQNLELIFLKFYQTGEVDLHSTDKTKFKGGGPGLGLTIAQGLVEAHGGKIWAESPGYDEQRCPGSRFHVYLPLRYSRARPDLASLKKN
jgi:signal transduction histidine kinase